MTQCRNLFIGQIEKKYCIKSKEFLKFSKVFFQTSAVTSVGWKHIRPSTAVVQSHEVSLKDFTSFTTFSTDFVRTFLFLLSV